MKQKRKGINAERELIHLFWGNNWAACRVAGSGSVRYPTPDIIASNLKRRLGIECKVTKDSHKYIPKKEIYQLKEFAKIFGCEPWIGVKLNKTQWFFLSVEDLIETPKSFLVNKDLIKTKAFKFNELIKTI